MYCPDCRCEYTGQAGRLCPVCGTPTVERPQSEQNTSMEALDYEELLDAVRQQDGNLSVNMTTTQVGREMRMRFPYLGYGVAWAKQMQGAAGRIGVELTAIEVKRVMKRRFPYLGYGFAWPSRLSGQIAGHTLILDVDRVQMKRGWSFPYFGYGYAWAEELSGTCGDQLVAHLHIGEIRRSRRRRFPYFGFGYAWEHKGVLTLSLRPPR